jgi:hypothetical protein
MVVAIVWLFIVIPLMGVLLPMPAVCAQSQMPDQRGAPRMLAGAGLIQKGRTVSLSVPVGANNGGAGNVSGILKGNGVGVVSAATVGTDYAPATSGTSILKGSGAGAFANAVSGIDYAPPSTGSAILKGNGSGGFTSASSGSDYAPATAGTALLKANGSGGFSNAASGTDYQVPIPGNSLPPHSFATSISSAGTVSGAQPGFADLAGSLATSQMPAITGDTISAAGSSVTTNVKVNGVTYSSSPSIDTVPVITGVNIATYTPLSNCADLAGNHLNYSTTTHTFSCGTSSSSSTPSFVAAMTASTALINYGGL